MTDILDDVPIHLNCPTEDCPGEIRTTFGKLRTDPEVTCHMCNTKTEVRFGEEELAQARAAIEASGQGGRAPEAGADGEGS